MRALIRYSLVPVEIPRVGGGTYGYQNRANVIVKQRLTIGSGIVKLSCASYRANHETHESLVDNCIGLHFVPLLVTIIV